MANLAQLVQRIDAAQAGITLNSDPSSDSRHVDELIKVAEESREMVDPAALAQVRQTLEQATSNIMSIVDEKYAADPPVQAAFHAQIAQIDAVYEVPVCFTRGTCIETPMGNISIEQLRQGDLVITRSGPKPVKWIGTRSIKGMANRSGAFRLDSYPVHILPGALGGGVPATALSVSPGHHLFVDNVLVRARDLINGISIYQDVSIDEVHYLHIELEHFDVIKAHGVYSESWADGGNRDFFDNVDVVSLHADARERRRAPRPGFQVVRPGGRNNERLIAIQERLTQLAMVATEKAA